MDTAVILGDGEGSRKSMFRSGNQKVRSRHIKFERPSSHPNGNITQAVSSMNTGFKGEVRARSSTGKAPDYRWYFKP